MLGIIIPGDHVPWVPEVTRMLTPAVASCYVQMDQDSFKKSPFPHYHSYVFFKFYMVEDLNSAQDSLKHEHIYFVTSSPLLIPVVHRMTHGLSVVPRQCSDQPQCRYSWQHQWEEAG